MKGRVLIVDDERDMLDNCDRALSRAGYECRTLSDPGRFDDVFRQTEPDVLILDIRMPEIDGMKLLTMALADDPAIPVVMITGHATVASAVNAIREGAFDYLAKPFTNEQLAVAVDRAARHRRLTLENRALRENIAAFQGVVGTSEPMRRLLDQARKVAPTDVSVLILGESGTGKELIARNLHVHSLRKDGPFIPVDCAALPETLLESELFGHERGAFTGAVSSKVGLLVEANGGTLFLDEVTELSPGLQSKLLRVLEERQVRPVGSTRLIDVDIRVVAATNTDVDAAVASGRIREDLYYRLDVVRFHVPPLRERRSDVPLLLQTFLQQVATAMNRQPPRVSPDAWDVLLNHDWPGNVRELRNVAQRLLVMNEDGWVKIADLPEAMRAPATPRPRGSSKALPYAEASAAALRSFRADYVRSLLAEHNGNVSQAARAAGVSRRTVHRWIAELNGPTSRSDETSGR
ncbi:MAG: sigma-54-dependent transcriptional regulator [Gemmatimonadales bacterium]